MKTLPVTKFDERLYILAQNMIETMQANNGVGLAANQVGDLARVMVVQDDLDTTIVMVNPRILHQSIERRKGAERCLSLPDKICRVKRSTEVTVQYQDLEGVVQQYTGFNRTARCIQHELDHLDGILMLDRE